MVILENIDINKISNRFKFGISNRAKPQSLRLSDVLRKSEKQRRVLCGRRKREGDIEMMSKGQEA